MTSEKKQVQTALNYLKNDPEHALNLFNKVLDKNTDNLEALNGKGVALIKLHRFEEAETYFDKSLKIKENSTALINKGLICKSLNNYQLALEYYNQAINLNPGTCEILTILKKEIYNLNMDGHSMQLSDYNKKANYYIKKAIKYEKVGKLWDALDNYEYAIEQDMNCRISVNCMIKRLKFKLLQEFLFKKPIINNDRLSDLKVQAFKTYSIEEKPEKALKLINAALEINDDLDLLNYKGSVHFLLNEYAEALNCFEKCLKIDGNYEYALFNKGMVLRMMGQLKPALDCFDILLNNPENYNKVKTYQLEILEKIAVCKKHSVYQD